MKIVSVSCNSTFGWVLVVTILVLVTGCTYRSLYFERTDLTEQHFDQYLVRPRVFSHKETTDQAVALNHKGFNVSVRIEDTLMVASDDEWRQDAKVVDSLSQAFLKQVNDAFVVDSLVLYQLPEGSDRILLIHDGKSYSPRRDSFLTLQYGVIEIPPVTTGLRIVLYVTRPGDSGSVTSDSLLWSMNKIDEEGKGFRGLRDNAMGY
jgi:hypothetical protein